MLNVNSFLLSNDISHAIFWVPVQSENVDYFIFMSSIIWISFIAQDKKNLEVITILFFFSEIYENIISSFLWKWNEFTIMLFRFQFTYEDFKLVPGLNFLYIDISKEYINQLISLNKWRYFLIQYINSSF